MKKKIVLLCICAFTLGCVKNDECKEKECKTMCYEVCAPVCGCNGKTYENDCKAECHGIMEYTEGACE